MTIRRIALVAALGAALVWPTVASAHANLVRTVPADQAVLAHPPKDTRFTFDDPIRVASGIRAVRNGGESVLGGNPHVTGAGRTLVVPLAIRGDGDYTVLWRVISDDGHTEAGVISFGVGAGRAPPAPSLNATTGPSARDVVSRWLLFAGLLVAAGGAAFRLATGVGRSTLLLPAFVAVFLGASGLLPHHGTLATRFGSAYTAAVLISAFGATAAAISMVVDGAAIAAWAFALALLPLPSIAGHALDTGRPWFEVGVDVVHLAAASVWIGGLVQLAYALRRTPAAAPDVIRRFSALALGSVLVLAASGVLRAFGELRAVDQLWTTGYGRLLIVKTALLAVLVAIGWSNRYRLMPRNDLPGLRRTVVAELVLVAGLLVAVAILTDARPGRDHAAVTAAKPTFGAPPLPRAGAIVDGQEDGNLAVGIASQPHRVRVTVLGPDGVGADGLRVSILGAPAATCGHGCYETDASPRPTIPVVVEGRRFAFTLPLQATPAARLVARATRAFRSLRSVTYVERLASSPTRHIVSTFTLEAPDRLTYRIHGGASAVVIGTRRWDRTEGNWIPSQSARLPQPSPIWGTPVTDAHIVARTRKTITVTFLNPALPAWFRVVFDRVSLRPRMLKMVAAAHFMHHRYLWFDRPREIYPPRT